MLLKFPQLYINRHIIFGSALPSLPVTAQKRAVNVGGGGKPNQMARHMEESDIYLGAQTGGEELCLKVLSVKEHESGTVTVT